jgi:hypothetical protein
VLNTITPETAATGHYHWAFVRNYRLEDQRITTELRDGACDRFPSGAPLPAGATPTSIAIVQGASNRMISAFIGNGRGLVMATSLYLSDDYFYFSSQQRCICNSPLRSMFLRRCKVRLFDF